MVGVYERVVIGILAVPDIEIAYRVGLFCAKATIGEICL